MTRRVASLLLVHLLIALVLSAVSLWVLVRLSDSAANRHRVGHLMFAADVVTQRLEGLTLDDIRAQSERFFSDPVLPPSRSRPRAIRRHLKGPPQPMAFWLTTADGDILARTENATTAWRWRELTKPNAPLEIASHEEFFRMRDRTFVIRLDRDPPLYLVAHERRRPFLGPLFTTQAVLTFSTVIVALLFSASFTFFYLRRKSAGARDVLLRMEKGDLKARFPIHKVDEFGELMLDFNRMADEIEKLVSRVQETERARKNLLQEIGHDLRTPLTVLSTSFQTLRTHHDKMSEDDRTRLFSMIDSEIRYFTDLVENLMTIASLDEPTYRRSTEQIDLDEILRREAQTRDAANTGIRWIYTRATREHGHPLVLGDPNLILRLFKNAFDNAGKYAKSRVDVELRDSTRGYEIRIHDDGPGLSDADLAAYGTRKTQRARRESSDLKLSLGLGSVIMKAIASLHGGSIAIENRTRTLLSSESKTTGATVTIILPKSL